MWRRAVGGNLQARSVNVADKQRSTGEALLEVWVRSDKRGCPVAERECAYPALLCLHLLLQPDACRTTIEL
jgi:hypothetical protein